MANIITIKSGTSTPSAGTLYPNELGYNKTDNTLYIGLLNGGISTLCKPPVQIINSSSLYTDYASAKAVYNYAPSRTGANASGNWDISAHYLYSTGNICNIAKGYNYTGSGTGTLYINYDASESADHPITSYYLWNGLGSATGAGLANLYCKDITANLASCTANSYINFGSNSVGLKWTVANGTVFTLRPYSPGNIFQLTANDSTSLLSIDTSGNMSISGNIGTTNGFLTSTKNGNTVTIGSPNEYYCHFTNSANIPFYFNKETVIDGNIYPYPTAPRSCGTSANPWANTYTTSLTINGSAVADYIIGKGWSGDWFYHIYKSQLCEAWCYIHLTNVAITNAWGNIYESNLYRPPENLALSFSSMRRITIECAGADSAILGVEVAGWEGANYPAYFLTRAGSATVANVYLVAHASGYNVVP